jgi:hypothetical protein
MENLKACSVCGVLKPLSLYPGGERTTCKACKTRKHEQSCSMSYQAFLASLHGKAKSRVKTGSRAEHIDFTISVDDLVNLWLAQGGKCVVSGVFLTHHKDGSGTKDFNASIDRISNERGYSPENVRLVCYRVNIMRNILAEDMFYWWVKTIYNFSCD